jgi:hypothetical protein
MPPRCVLAECDRLYGAHGIPFFTLSCAVVDGKKQMRPPPNWQSAAQAELRFKGKNAACVRTGYCPDSTCPLVVVDADGADAIVVVEALLAGTCAGLVVPQVQTQRGPNGRHYYFRAGPTTNLRSGAKFGLPVRKKKGQKNGVRALRGEPGQG